MRCVSSNSKKNLASIEMIFQALHETGITPSLFNQGGYILDYIERIRPFITFSPSGIFSCPRSISILGFHESSFRIKDSKGVLGSTFAEMLGGSGGFFERRRQDGQGIIVV